MSKSAIELLLEGIDELIVPFAGCLAQPDANSVTTAVSQLGRQLAHKALKLHAEGHIDAAIHSGPHDLKNKWDQLLVAGSNDDAQPVLDLGPGNAFRDLAMMLLARVQGAQEKLDQGHPFRLTANPTPEYWRSFAKFGRYHDTCPVCGESVAFVVAEEGTRLFEALTVPPECFKLGVLHRGLVNFPTGRLLFFDAFRPSFYERPEEIAYTKMSLNHSQGLYRYTEWLRETFNMASVHCGNSVLNAYWNEELRTLLVGWFPDHLSQGWVQVGRLCADVWQARLIDILDMRQHLAETRFNGSLQEASENIEVVRQSRQFEEVCVPPGQYEMQYCVGDKVSYDRSTFPHYPEGAQVVMMLALVRK